MTIFHKAFRMALLISTTLPLAACSHHWFHNHENNYVRQETAMGPVIKVPKNVTTPQFQPAITIPPGQTHYAPSQPVDLTPPGYHAVVVAPKESAKDLADAIAKGKVAPYKPNYNQPIHIAPAPSLPKAIPTNTNAAMPALPAAAVTHAKKMSQPATKAKPAATAQTDNQSDNIVIPDVPHLSSSIHYDQAGHASLNINADFSATWPRVMNAIKAAGISVMYSDSAHGIIRLGRINNQLGLSLYIAQSSTNSGQTSVDLFNQNMQLQGGEAAGDVLKKIQMYLNPQPL